MHRLALRLDALLPRCPDPGMALANLERFVAACPAPDEMIVLLAESARTTEILVQLFSTSQHLSEMMIRDPSLLDWLRWGAERRDRDAMVFDLWAELAGAADETDQRLDPPPVPPARDAADRLQRHRPRPAPGTDHARPLRPGRRLRRGRLPARPREGRGPARRPLRPRRPARAVRRAGPGQARRRRS